jgi:hypothetical protein
MLQKLVIIVFLSITTNLNVHAQKELVINPFSKAEIALLDFISADTVQNLNLNFFEEDFRFGVSYKLANGICLLKNKGSIYLQLMGSGRLYQILKKGQSNYEMIRLDSTFHSGYNFGTVNFFYKDTLFQHGGIGFWKIKDFFTFFSQKTHEWEIYMSNRKVPNFLSSNDGLFFQVNENTGKLYLSHSIRQIDFPNTLSTIIDDSCRVFDFKTHMWSNLGKLNPLLKEIGAKSVFLKSNFGPYLLFHADLELYWLNFSTNQYGTLTKDKQAEYREKWLKLYKNKPAHMFQFAMGSNFYLIRIEQDGQFTYESISLTEKDFVDPDTAPIYTNNFFTSFLKMIEPGKPIIGNAFIVLIVLLIYTLYKKRFKKKKIPLEVQTILYKNFYTSLTIVEKELIQSIYQLQIKNEQISIKTINKIIGVQQKDTITQNKSRSDIFLRINQKFKLATRETDALIVKQREETDKRQYNYNINPVFIKQIEKLILNNQ